MVKRDSRGFALQCWSCGSSNFKETVSREKCFNCGLECDYWAPAKQTNEVYDRASAIRRENEDERREQLQREWETANGYDEFYG